MFAGEGGAVRTNRRFRLLSASRPATRLSTVSMTLNGPAPTILVMFLTGGSSSTRCATSARCRSAGTTSPRRGRTRSASWRSPSPTGSPTLKYHGQTSGRSLHAQEMDFNDIRTTLQALCAIYYNAHSLHTNT
jgi:methylmalonyl-CoA mutase N-terminal domain/subunit